MHDNIPVSAETFTLQDFLDKAEYKNFNQPWTYKEFTEWWEKLKDALKYDDLDVVATTGKRPEKPRVERVKELLGIGYSENSTETWYYQLPIAT